MYEILVQTEPSISPFSSNNQFRNGLKVAELLIYVMLCTKRSVDVVCWFSDFTVVLSRQGAWRAVVVRSRPMLNIHIASSWPPC